MDTRVLEVHQAVQEAVAEVLVAQVLSETQPLGATVETLLWKARPKAIP